MTSFSPRFSLLATAFVVGLLALPGALSVLTGSGNVEDIVQLDVVDDNVPVLSAGPVAIAASGAPVASTDSFEVSNDVSNVDTLIRFDWDAAPHYGGVTTQTSIDLRGNTHQIGDLLWFRQEARDGNAALARSSDLFSPLVIADDAAIETTSFVDAGDACLSWGTVPTEFTPSAAGTFTFSYHDKTSPADDAPATATYHYCVGSSQVFLNTAPSFTGATRVHMYTTDSTGGVLENYVYEFEPGAATTGNTYCLVAIAGTGTDSTPKLAQCQLLEYDPAGAYTAQMFVLYDPPAYFPSVNQGGEITYALAGTQWNPYAHGTTQPA